MRRYREIALLAASAVLTAFVAVTPAHAEVSLPAALQVLGTVTNAAHPVANALVIALNTNDLAATQVWTGRDGSFTLPSLRTGVYKIIAVKSGFAPLITTILPTKPSHRLALRLETEKQAARRKTANQEIWELRGSLPADVLRDLDFALEPAEVASYEIPRFRGEMSSLTGVTNQTANPAYAQTSLGVQGRIGDSWQVGLRGNLQRFEDPNDGVRFGPPVASSSAMSMELRSASTQTYRVGSTKSSWTYRDGEGEQQADFSAHNFEWQSGPARVEVRYFEQDNLFRETPVQSNRIEIGGTMPILQTRRSDLGIALRVTQESIETNTDALRTADLSADGTMLLVPTLVLHYGMASRIGLEGQELAPRTGAEWKLTENTSIIGSVLYKVLDRDPSGSILPNLVFWSESSRVLPRYEYTVGFVSGKEGKNRFSAIATVSAVDDPLRVVFADESSQFWDGLYVETGDVRRDVRLAYRRDFGNRFAIDVAGTAGTASSSAHRAENEREKIYVTGDLQSTFIPTRTSLAVSYREIQQPGDNGDEDYQTERINLRMAQSLYLPVDIKLLLGLELARAENSPYLMDSLTPEGRSKKYIGGLALNF